MLQLVVMVVLVTVLKIMLAVFVIGGFAILLGAAILQAYRSIVKADDEEDDFWNDGER